MFEKIKSKLYTDRSNAYKAAISTAGISFVSLFGLSLLNFVQDISNWATDTTGADFPSIAPLGKAFVSAITASFIGFFNWAFRVLQTKDKLPGSGPTY